MTTRRVRGASLGLVIILVNILLVGVLVMATSNRTVSDLFDPDDAAPTTGGPTPDAVQDTGTATSEPTVMPPPTGEIATADAPDLEQSFADGDDLTVVVLGDQTGADPADWVRAWAELLGTERTVDYRTPTASDPTVYGDAVTFGDGEDTVEIFNASLVGGTPDYAAERLELYLPSQTDVVVLNYGRSNTQEDLEQDLDELWTALEETGVEARVVIQPPRQDGAEPLTEQTREWARGVDATTIDVAEAFEGEELTALTVSTRDPLSVNLAGAARWAQIVQAEVFGVELAPVESTSPPEILPPSLPTATQPADEELPVEPGPTGQDPPPYEPPAPTYEPPAPTYNPPPAPTYTPPPPTYTPPPPPPTTTPPPPTTSPEPPPTTTPPEEPTEDPTPTVGPAPTTDPTGPTGPTATWVPDPGPGNPGGSEQTGAGTSGDATLGEALRALLLRR